MFIFVIQEGEVIVTAVMVRFKLAVITVAIVTIIIVVVIFQQSFTLPS